MRGLALEGGGARGAYHIGVIKAFLENGYAFDGFVGTSIGAINSAFLAQGDFEKALEIWSNISMEQLFDIDEQLLLTINEVKFNMKLPAALKKSLRKVINKGGVDNSKIKNFISRYIDEDKIRQSGKDYGLVTISLSERKAYEVFIENILPGALINYIMASASFPGFIPEIISEKKFLDGGLYDNCPINLLIKKNYDEIIAVRTLAPGVFRKIKKSDADIKIISPYEDLGNIILFTKENSMRNINIGYLDGLRFIKKLRGCAYYINPVGTEDFYMQLFSLEDNLILNVGKILDIPPMPAKRMLFEHIIPKLSTFFDLNQEKFDYADFVIALLEYAAKQKEIERYKVYDYAQLYSIVKNSSFQIKEKNISLIKNFQIKKKAVELLIDYLFLGEYAHN